MSQLEILVWLSVLVTQTLGGERLEKRGLFFNDNIRLEGGFYPMFNHEILKSISIGEELPVRVHYPLEHHMFFPAKVPHPYDVFKGINHQGHYPEFMEKKGNHEEKKLHFPSKEHQKMGESIAKIMEEAPANIMQSKHVHMMDQRPVNAMQNARPVTLMIMSPIRTMGKDEMEEEPKEPKEKTVSRTVPMTVEKYVKHHEADKESPAPVKEQPEESSQMNGSKPEVKKAPYVVVLPVDETYRLHLPFDKKVTCHCERAGEGETTMKKQVVVMKEIPSHNHVQRHIPVHPANYHH